MHMCREQSGRFPSQSLARSAIASSQPSRLSTRPSRQGRRYQAIVIGSELGLGGGIRDVVGNLDFELIGIAIIAIFLVSWTASTLVYRWRRYDDLPVSARTGAGGASS